MSNQRPRPRIHRIFTGDQSMTDQARVRRTSEPPAAGTRPERTDGAEQPQSNADAGEIERLTAELEAARQQAAEHLSGLQRERAEFTNFRRRTTEEREREMGLASEYLLAKVLTIADDFDRAIDAVPDDVRANAWTEGITAIDRKLRGLLESEGVRPIEALGRPFDPREHEAVANVPGTGRPDGEIVTEIRRGYRLRDKVLRPALVAVAAGGPGETTADSGPGAGDTPGATTTDTTTN
jgi:molecular chaperone GrpE